MKKFLFVLGGILLIITLVINIKISFKKNELSGGSILATQNSALAQSETNDGFIANNDPCTYQWYAWDPFAGQWVYYESPGHITDCLIEFVNLGCDQHACIWN